MPSHNLKTKKPKNTPVLFCTTQSAPVNIFSYLSENKENFFTQFGATEFLCVATFAIKHERLQTVEEVQAILHVLEEENKKISLEYAVFSEQDLHIEKHSTQINQLSNPAFTIELNKEKIQLNISTDIDCYEYYKSFFSKKNKSIFCFTNKDFFELHPVFIPKPWGQEVWFTGVETRGISLVTRNNSSQNPVHLTWLTHVFPTILGLNKTKQDLVLVKILDPVTEEVFGDLYYELHTEKNEVYVVTHISGKTGRIKIGFNAEKLKQFSGNIDKFKKTFLEKIIAYEKTRRTIDLHLDRQKEKENIPINSPLSKEKTQQLHKTIPQELATLEKKQREEMDSFCGYLNLNLGDVIHVPTHIPHALQHGVRVVEFQTPTYERYIVSFAQKVLTQNNWDTHKAFAVMQNILPEKTKLKKISATEKELVEAVCSFSDFIAERHTLKKDGELMINNSENYSVIFIVSGSLIEVENTKNQPLKKDQCFLIPAHMKFQFKSTEPTIVLLCKPNA